MSRSAISTTGAMMPQLAKPGSTPMKNVPTPISVIVTRNVYFRPIKSPKWPKISAPNGRTAKPAANVSSAKMKPTFGGTLEKKYLARKAPSVP